MSSRTDLRVIHVYPHSARLGCGHTNAITAFMESEVYHGLNVEGICPLPDNIPPERSIPIEHLPIHELDFCAAGFPAKAMAMADGVRGTVFHFAGITRPNVRLGAQLKKSRRPYVFTSHGQLNCHGRVNWLKKFIYLNLVSPFVRDASGLHFLTQAEANRCKFLIPRWRGQALVQGNLAKVPNPALISPLSREQLGFPREAFVFAYLGRLDVATKGLDYLMKAFAKVAAGKDCFLVLVGPDLKGGRAFLERLAERLNCGKRIRFLGPQYGDEKWRALKLADAFVSPSRWEAFAVAQAEAIAFGVPTLVSTKVNNAPELVDAQAALAAPLSEEALAEQMQRLMDDASLRRSLSDAGRRWAAENCSMEAAGARFEEFYLRVLGSPH